MRFTNSPYEKMMREIPRMETPRPSMAPKGTRCHKCPYWRGIACVACYLDLMKKPEGR